jgi:hypothetical protein
MNGSDTLRATRGTVTGAGLTPELVRARTSSDYRTRSLHDSERALHIVDEHACLIQTIFAGYLEHGAVSALQRHLSDARLYVPDRIDGAGRRTGGRSGVAPPG